MISNDGVYKYHQYHHSLSVSNYSVDNEVVTVVDNGVAGHHDDQAGAAGVPGCEDNTQEVCNNQTQWKLSQISGSSASPVYLNTKHCSNSNIWHRYTTMQCILEIQLIFNTVFRY